MKDYILVKKDRYSSLGFFCYIVASSDDVNYLMKLRDSYIAISSQRDKNAEDLYFIFEQCDLNSY